MIYKYIWRAEAQLQAQKLMLVVGASAPFLIKIFEALKRNYKQKKLMLVVLL